MSKLVVGAWVRCERDAPAKGTWPRYAGRVGRVVILNAAAGEWGVRFTADNNEPTKWFLHSELVVVDQPVTAPFIRVESDRDRAQEQGRRLRAVPVSDETFVGVK